MPWVQSAVVASGNSLPAASDSGGAPDAPPRKASLDVTADMERKRSVPKKEKQKEPLLPTKLGSLLPYGKQRMRRQWSSKATMESGNDTPMAGALVLKFGGSSCGSRMGQVLQQVEDRAASGQVPVAVVVSAMGKTTDRLIDAADASCAGRAEDSEASVKEVERIALRNVAEHAPAGTCPGAEAAVAALLSQLRELLLGVSLVQELSPASLDRMLSFGERLSAAVLAALLTARGVAAHAVDSSEWVVTDEAHGQAAVEWEETQRALSTLVQRWPVGSVPVVTGFLGATAGGRRTTLGRNGSDYTAALLALGLGASRVVVNTDVPGVFTADPRIVKDAYPVPELSYVEAVELAVYGSGLFHPRTILPLIECGIPMTIRDTMDPHGAGTTICAVPDCTEAATCVTTLESLVMLILRSRLRQRDHKDSKEQHIGVRMTGALNAAGVPINYASFAANGQAVHVVCQRSDEAAATATLLREFDREIRDHELEEMAACGPVTLLSLVRAPQAVVPRFFSALTAAKVRVRSVGQGANSASLSCVVDAEDTAVAVRAAHAAINLGRQVVSLLVLGNNPTARGLLRRIAEKADELRARHRVEMRVVGVLHTCVKHRSSNTYYDAATGGVVGVKLQEYGIDCAAEAARMETEEERCDALPAPDGWTMADTVPVAVLQRLRQMPAPMVVDCSRLEVPNAGLYAACHEMAIHVVVSNAKSIVRLSSEPASAAGAGALGCEPLLTYDSCVGAGVPISDTVRTLNQMGDLVTGVEASLSGTAGFIIEQLMDGVALSAAVARAAALGYTEPDVADDLSGRDMARKLCVLSRQMGRQLDLEEVQLQGLAPDAGLAALARACTDAERAAALEACDDEIRREVDAARACGERIAFVGRIDFAASPARGSPPRSADPVVASVRRARVRAGHAAHGLRGVEIYAELRCDGARATELPIKVHGPGCGSASALGVVSDILKVALRLQGTLPAADPIAEAGQSPALFPPAAPVALTPSQMLF